MSKNLQRIMQGHHDPPIQARYDTKRTFPSSLKSGQSTSPHPLGGVDGIFMPRLDPASRNALEPFTNAPSKERVLSSDVGIVLELRHYVLEFDEAKSLPWLGG